MQYPMGERSHRTLILRGEVTVCGKNYATCLDPDSEIRVSETEGETVVTVCAAFTNLDGEKAKGASDGMPLMAEITYRIAKETVTVSFRSEAAARWILPVREDGVRVGSAQEMNVEPVFYLAGGFAMNEFTVCGNHADFVLNLP